MDKQGKQVELYVSNGSLIAALDEETVSAAWNAFGNYKFCIVKAFMFQDNYEWVEE